MLLSINLKAVAMLMTMAFLAVFTGLVATTANPVLIALLVGLMGGVALLLVPQISIWVLLIFGMTSGFLASVVPGLTKLPWALALLSMLLMLPVSIKFIETKKIPGFIWMALAFMLFAIFATAVQWNSLAQLMAGFKRYFQMYGLMFALTLLAFKPEEYKRWLKLMLIIGLIQLPFALYEYFVLAGMRGGRGISGAEASDVVAGTLGANMEGGSANAEMAAFLIMTMAFLLARWKAGLIEKPKAALMGMICLLPLGLGETKIVIVLLPLVWLILMRDDLRKKAIVFLTQFIGLLLITALFGLIYLGLNKSSLSEVISLTFSYNFGTQGYGLNILNRSTVIDFWWNNQSWSDPVGMFLGHGLGSAYFSPGNAVPGHIAVKFIGYGIDMTSVSSLLWDVGILGVLMFFSIFIMAWRAAGRLSRTANHPSVRADGLAIQGCIAIFVIFTFYDSALVNYLPFEAIAASVLGYLGYLVRSESHQNNRNLSR
jgi:hypothetical protein